MKLVYLTAVSSAALALMACGGERTYADNEADDQAVEETETARYDGDADTGQTTAGDRYGETAQRETAQNAGTADAYGSQTAQAGDASQTMDAMEESARNLASAQPTPTMITLAEVRTANDVGMFARRAFAQADRNSDNRLSQTEFAELASALDAGAIPTGGGDEGVEAGDSDRDAGMADMGDDMQTASGDVSEERYERLAGADNEMGEEDLRSYLLSQFAEADENGDDRLNDSELDKFVQIAWAEEGDADEMQ